MNQKVDEKFYTKSNFGIRGWGIIVFVGVLLMLCSMTNNDGLNVIIPAITTEHGWDYAAILAYSTPAGLITVVGTLLISILTDKKGAKFTTMLCLIISGLAFIWYGNAQTPIQYFIALSLVSTFATSGAWISGGAYLSSYFPRKKGLALGWATMGNNLSSVAMVPLLALLIGIFGGMGKVSIIFGIVIIALAFVCLAFPNNPEDCGMGPDNLPMTKEEIEAYREESNAYVSPWTIGKLLKSKEMWLIAIVLGLTMMMTVGIVSQLVARLMEPSIGWTQPQAVTALSVASAIGIFGSYMFGWLDQKITTKKAVFVYMIWYALAAFINVIPSPIALYVSLIMIGFALGGNANWPVSLCSSVFGHRNFAKVYTLVCPIYTLMRACTYVVLSFFIATTGSLSGAYIMFGILGLIGAVLVLFVNDKKYAE